MDLHQLKTFAAVAREGSITRAAERLYLSQPAISAHIKAMEDGLGLQLFARTPKGMRLTADGMNLLALAERALAAHRELLEEAARIRGRLTGKLRLGAGSSAPLPALGQLLLRLAERCPEVEVALQHVGSDEVLDGLRAGQLDAGFYNEAGTPDPELATCEVGRFAIYLAAPPGLVSEPLDWSAIAELPWVCPASGGCCGQAAEALFSRHGIRPKRVISVDREKVTRTLVAGGVGVGLLHEETALAAQAAGEVQLVCEALAEVRVMFAHLTSRQGDPLITALRGCLVEA